jgi:peptidoglycan/xylan/chitin deacetylase (PgdA/CDA1 family)
MQPTTFSRRMALLKTMKLPVLGFSEAIGRLQNRTLPKDAVTITIDDGWYGTYAHMLPVLKGHGFPATVYIASYYVEKQTFIFRMFVRYILSTGKDGLIDLAEVNPALEGMFRLDSDEERKQAGALIGDYGERCLDAAERDDLCRALAACLDFDVAQAEQRRMFKFMNCEELASLPGKGFDVQLHTHRHRFSPSDREEAAKEIRDNIRVLTRLGIPAATHFCYPSGEYAPDHPAWLEALGIESAVTTDRGFCTTQTPRFLLSRLCDSEHMSDIEFEADLSGLLEILRRIRKRVRKHSSH